MEGFEVRQSIDLARENGVLRRAQPIERGDVKALRWIVTVTRNGEPEDLSGATAAIYCARTNAPTVRSDEDIIIDGNTVSGFLPQDAANAPGLVVCEFSIAHGSDGPAFVLARMTLEAADTIGDDVIDQGNRIPGYEQLLAEIEAMRQATQEARQATQSANEQAQAAQTAASNASTQASAAQQAAQKIQNLSATAQTLAPGSQATANVSSTENGFEVKLGIPMGAAGPVPNITFKVKTGEPGTDVEITQGGTPEAPTVELTIPRGMPGTGNVSSVCGVQPGTDGDVPLTAENVGARPVDWLPNGLIYPTTAQALEAMSQEQQAELYAQGYRAIVATYNETTTMHALAADGSLAWVGCNQGTENQHENPDFGVAQAGYGGTHGQQVYAADRWALYNARVLNGEPGKLILTNDGGAGQIYQRFFPKPGPVTIGFYDTDGSVNLVLAEIPETLGVGPDLIASGENIDVYVNANTIQANFNFSIPQGGSQSFSRMFCYSGSYTSKTLPPWVATDPVAELIKCQRYYWRFKSAQFVTIGLGYESAAYAFFQIGLPVEMRTATPTFVQNGVINLLNRPFAFTQCRLIGNNAIIGVNYDAIPDPSGAVYAYARDSSGVVLDFCDDL